MVSFILTMPNKGSWNGKWAGEGNLYCIIKKLDKDKEADMNGWLTVLSNTIKLFHNAVAIYPITLIK